ncbi:(d)CMP kinase [Lysinibacillus sphaericus]|uniref:Cytidylate kinase n=1 Tax=Lysinibacillus sphaericus TaxID=1421 RepID=A0A2S0K2K9_LYSSH|nr:(d)CMP kinase [Lysinibacillus sphaericus]AVK97610.1 cytidylate kinase [Lysinibacillus sphaericus]MED4545521.1 (d)CMP kinase [Lysinibacillus sphaericus]TKI17811.1 (d)CMP kinase [Lysinibacillus sphaericus]SUV16474.1 cytidylate kinase [Lysinibacillus sphaericus]GEC82460.1 cytidylate kinase [Lysinibacillus sphaericus]
MNKNIQIAIDGPAGAGKSTIAKIVAESLGFTYIDTGAMYRAVTYKAMQQNIHLDDEAKLAEMLAVSSIELKPSPQGQLVFLDGENVSDAIRSNEVTSSVSQVAAHAKVRELLVAQQQKLAANGGVVMDGRDIATHVLKNAELKIFMSATVEERARRRFIDNEKRGIASSIEMLQEEIALRDKMDSEREASPLIQAADAIFLDTTELSIDAAAQAILKLAQEKMV